MARSLRLLLCASAAALMLGAAPGVDFVAPAKAQVDIVVSAAIAPPSLPVYAQPPIPGLGYVWIPGYWAWDGVEYYWVPGYWALPPTAGLYWTPGYWAWDDSNSDYVFYAGYWGPTVGYYGGIDYGYGYAGNGYHGGYWRHNRFYYNRAVNNLDGLRIANVYTQPVPAQPTGVAFHGGHGGTTLAPTPQQLALARAHHAGLTAAQTRHVELARQTPGLRFNQNHGAPPIAATARPGSFHGPHVVAAQGSQGAHVGPAAEHVGAAAAAGAAAGAAGALAVHHAMSPPHARQAPAATAAAGGHHMRQARPENAPAQRGFAAREAGPRHNFETHAPAHGQAMRENFGRYPTHAQAGRPNVAAHRQPMRAAAAPRNFARESHMRRGAPGFEAMRPAHPGPMRFGGGAQHAPYIAAAPRFGAPHFGGMPGGAHFAPGGFGGPRFGGMGGAPHFGGGGPHFGGGGPHFGGGGPHMGGGGPHMGGPHVP